MSDWVDDALMDIGLGEYVHGVEPIGVAILDMVMCPMNKNRASEREK